MVKWAKSYHGSDERYTPRYGVEPLIKHLNSYKERKGLDKLVVWCPFDRHDEEIKSNFVVVLSEAGFEVKFSHIDYGQDFFSTKPPEGWDILVSNPSFSNKKEIFMRALAFGKPICLLMTMQWLNDSGSKKAFIETKRDMQLLMFTQRMEYINASQSVGISFSSGYYCSDFLEKDIMFDTFNKVKIC